MDTQQLRVAFMDFAGPSMFRRFVVQLRRDAPQETHHERRHDGLRYWQTELWRRFRKTHPGAPDDIDPIRSAMLWCDLHEQNLADGAAVNPMGVHAMPEFVNAMDSLFPFGYGFWNLVCCDCVAACKAWVETHRPDVEMEESN